MSQTHVTYSYDPAGNPTSITHVTDWSTDTECFDYDNRQRLNRAYTLNGTTTCPTPGTAVTPSGQGAYLDNYTSDQLTRITNFDGNTHTYGVNVTGCAAGSQTSKPHALNATNGGGVTETFTYNCNGALTTTNQTAGPDPGVTTNTWDTEQRLTTVTNTTGTTTNLYDTTNNRVLRIDPDGTKTLYLGPTEIRYTPTTSTIP